MFKDVVVSSFLNAEMPSGSLLINAKSLSLRCNTPGDAESHADSYWVMPSHTQVLGQVTETDVGQVRKHVAQFSTLLILCFVFRRRGEDVWHAGQVGEVSVQKASPEQTLKIFFYKSNKEYLGNAEVSLEALFSSHFEELKVPIKANSDIIGSVDLVSRNASYYTARTGS
jgi:hypothetical protein